MIGRVFFLLVIVITATLAATHSEVAAMFAGGSLGLGWMVGAEEMDRWRNATRD